MVKPINLLQSAARKMSRMLALFLLVFVLVACGTNTSATSPSGPSSKGTTNKPTSTPSPLPQTGANFSSLDPNPAPLSIKNGDLLIQSDGSLQCSNRLVLATDRTTYRSDEIASMNAYVTGFMHGAATSAQLPSILRWVLGGSRDPIPATSETENHAPPCSIVLNLTNTGNTPIQIPKVGVQLEASPQPNTYHYHLIDACSVLLPPQPDGCFQPFGGGNDCSSYTASIQLDQGMPDDEFSAVPRAQNDSGEDCGILTVAPTTPIKLEIDFSLDPTIPKNLIYSVAPVFTIDTAQREQTLTFSQMRSTLAFASASEFSCYTLQGTTFRLVPSPTLASNYCL